MPECPRPNYEQGVAYDLLLDYRDEDRQLTPFVNYFESLMKHCNKVLPGWRRGG